MKFIYNQIIDENKYRSVNKDRDVNVYFGVEYVGRCQKLFNDYYIQAVKVDRKDWEKYYGENFGWNKLADVYYKIEDMCKTRHNLTEQEIKQYIFYRVIGQTWNGLIKEEEVITQLVRSFPDYNFSKTSFDMDHNFCIDWEMYLENKLVLGLQVKPVTYLYMNSPYQLKAKENHRAKNNKYAKFYAPYIYVYYDENGIYKKNKLIDEINIKKIL